jgi:hypothetical protein
MLGQSKCHVAVKQDTANNSDRLPVSALSQTVATVILQQTRTENIGNEYRPDSIKQFICDLSQFSLTEFQTCAQIGRLLQAMHSTSATHLPTKDVYEGGMNDAMFSQIHDSNMHDKHDLQSVRMQGLNHFYAHVSRSNRHARKG